MKIFDKLMYIFLYLLGFIIIGIASFIQPGVGFKPLDWVIVLDNILTYAAIICIIVATLLNIVDKFKNTNEEYKDASATIKDFASSKAYIPSIFSRFCSYTNYNRKLKQHEYNIKKQLTKLEQKSTDNDFYVWNYGSEEQRKANKYCNQRAILEYKLSDEWCEKNLHIFNIKYDKISSAIILSGVFNKAENNSPNDFITKGKTGKIAREKIPQLFMGFAITCFTSSVVISMAINPSALLNLAVKSMVLCWHTFMTIRYANTWKEIVTLKDIRWRKGVITEYYKWLQQEAESIKEHNQEVTATLVRENEKATALQNENNLTTEEQSLEVNVNEYSE